MAKKRTELVRKLLKRFGYDLRRLQKTHIHDENPGYYFDHDQGFDGFESIIPKRIRHLDIFFRCCSGVEIFGQTRKRLGNVPKSEVLLRSLNSIVRSIAYAREQGMDTKLKLTCMDDHSADTVVEQIKSLLQQADCETEFVALEVTGNGASEGEVLRRARSTARDVIYFVEDDYIHQPQAILEIVMSYERFAALFDRDIVLFPCDEPNRYRDIDSTQVFLGSHRHWRTVQSTTFSLLTTAAVLKTYWDLFIQLEKYGIDPDVTEASTIHHIYKTHPCLSPLPALAVHHQQIDTLPPYVDWKQWWENAAIPPKETIR